MQGKHKGTQENKTTPAKNTKTQEKQQKIKANPKSLVEHKQKTLVNPKCVAED